jgi:hypothetical protein
VSICSENEEIVNTIVENLINPRANYWGHLREVILMRGRNPLVSEEELAGMLGYQSAVSIWQIVNKAESIPLSVGPDIINYSPKLGGGNGRIQPLFSQRGLNLTKLGNEVYRELERRLKEG